MNFASIRWRLPASYAAVALLAALALGSLMLLVLNGYYTRQERDFLLGNAEAARSVVEQVLQSNLSGQALADQVKGLAFLSQAQIRVLDGNGNLLADSGVPDTNQMVSLSSNTQGIAVLSVGEASTVNGVVVQGIGNAGTIPVGPSTPLVQGTEIAGTQVFAGKINTSLPVSASPFGYGLAAAQPVETQRSEQVVSVPLLSRPGSLEISNGPAYGADILRSVALAWLAASLAAVALAGLVGIVASRQVTQPVLALTDAARRMQCGDLSIRAALGLGRQVQEFSTLAETFNQMAQRVEDTVSTLRAFVSDAAHELNTPLTALRTNLELALSEPDGGQREIFLGRAVEQNLRLERLAGGLLDLSRLETSQTAPEAEPLDLARLAAEIGERFASRAEQAERSFTLDLPAFPLTVQGNSLQLQRMIDNLLENALKFTPSGGTIRLSLESKDNQAVLCVRDTGIGIPADDMPHLFERFHRGCNSADYLGTGLGLAIVKAIVELHGGQVEAQSAGRGQGSQFYVRLAIL
jgi:signal transduction histidine kinase